MPEERKPDLRLAAAGDSLITRRITHEGGSRQTEFYDRIREADVGFANLETILHDYDGYPTAQTGDVYLRSPPWTVDELRDVGFNLFAVAHNHAGDYSHGGMLATMRELERRNAAYAGLGRNLAQARAADYVETPAGRVGLVAATSSYVAGTQAGPQGAAVQGRPGISPLDVETTYRVPAEDLDRLRTLSRELGFEDVKSRRNELGFPPPFGGYEQEGSFRLMNVGEPDIEFEAAEDYAVTRRPDAEDLAAITAEVDAANRSADWVVVSLHAHQGAGGRNTDHTVPEFLETTARKCIDTGADAVIGHGPHVLRGIELYDGAPIFYSLGNFVFQPGMVSRLPAAAYEQYDLPNDARTVDWIEAAEQGPDGEPRGFLTDRRFFESVVPICRFDGEDLDRIELHPIQLGFDQPRSSRGIPRPATGDTARRIVEYLSELSAPYGTELSLVDGYGLVDC